MATVPNPPHLHPGGNTPDGAPAQLEAVLNVALTQAKEEYDRTERIEAKFRNLVSVVGTFFVLAQTGAGSVLAAVKTEAQTLSEAIIVVAVIAMLALVATLCAGSPIYGLRNRRTISAEGLKQLVRHAEAGKTRVTTRLIEEYATIIGQRQEENEERANAYDFALQLAGAVVVLLFIEIALIISAASLAL